MTTLTEGMHAGEFLVSEANGTRSREIATLTSGQDLEAGTVVATVSAKLVAFDQDGADGSETITGILYDGVDASGADQPCVVIVRDAEVNGAELVWPADIEAGEKTTAIAALAALGIIVR